MWRGKGKRIEDLCKLVLPMLVCCQYSLQSDTFVHNTLLITLRKAKGVGRREGQGERCGGGGRAG